MCYEDCPSGYTDLITTCGKPLSYLRSPCSYWNRRGCKKIGWFYYPKCKSGYYDDGAWCRYGCPDGMADLGDLCERDSYNRGYGTKPADCPKGQEIDTGLCYPECTFEDSDGTMVDAEGVGPVCWGSCPEGTQECGGICLNPDETCDEYVEDVTIKAMEMATNYAAQNYWKAVINTIEFADELGLDEPQCEGW